MSFRISRKTTPRVRRGKVQRKNRWALTPSIFNTPQPMPVIHRERPGPGYRHLLLKRDIVRFLSILPEWEELSRGLNVILLARQSDRGGWQGWHTRGLVAVCAWNRDLWQDLEEWFFEEHRLLIGRLGVPWEQTEAGTFVCKFTEDTARAFQLLHVLMHELGHHHDRMTTRWQRDACRGESYAEQYAKQYEERIFKDYVQAFGLEVP